MIKTNLPIFLASKSPRRKHLLSLLNIPFDSFSVETEEIFDHESTPEENVLRLAEEKMTGARRIKSNGLIITADTIVVLENNLLGKPEDEDDAFRMLTSLSDKSHHVFTGICVYSSETNQQFLEYEKTEVTFSAISENEIRDYIRSGSPLDKAGSYGIQDDYGAVFISKIDGCFYNVVGLPLNRLYNILMRIGN